MDHPASRPLRMERTPKITNFDFCPLFAWMSNFGDPLFPFISWFGQLFFVWPEFLNLANPNFSIRTFTGRARHFAYGETVREAPLVATGKISESAVLFRHVLRTFAAFTCFSIRSHCVTPVYFCYLPLCREDRKILLIPIGYDKA